MSIKKERIISEGKIEGKKTVNTLLPSFLCGVNEISSTFFIKVLSLKCKLFLKITRGRFKECVDKDVEQLESFES